MPYSEMCNFVGKMPHSTPESIRVIRIEMGLSQSQIASLLCLSRFTISKMERGLYPISRRLDYSLAFLMDVHRRIVVDRIRCAESIPPRLDNSRHQQAAIAVSPVSHNKPGKKKRKRR